MRFQLHPIRRAWRWPVLSALAFFLVLTLFLTLLRDFSADTRRRQREAMETAVNRAIVACYAMEGKYPQSLEQIQKNYSFTYDEDRFFLDYQFQGDNIMPEVTILERGE